MAQARFAPVKKCIFGCGNKANSREHGWSDWANKIIPVEGIAGEVDGLQYANPLQKNLRIKCVCIPCNTRWMKGLEDFAVLTAGEMLQDRPLSLDIPQQMMLARWAMKHAMVFEFTSRSTEPFYSDHERLAFRLGTMPPHSAVWLARCEDVAAFYTRSNVLLPPERNGYAASVFTCAYRHLVVQVVTVRVNEEDERIPVLNGDVAKWRNHMVRLWPTARSTIRWPPPDTIPPGQLDADPGGFHYRVSGFGFIDPPSTDKG